ncbi:hypothetical protein SAMN02910384_00114 [Pseudobutyrivibrio sp. ACV-2]|uniref:hypothetical protein n=1 Tax=Pseudobutyrivibrio sp. ACV-2 TaxID=1520801 RepID=UPI00089B1FFD|nr:hypothetical protein [Pseudobutyrivibrio sp. ACV-2]SDZ79204.1 hypothetical protein SAMN02910384_00114 [Pseudobutyrivibrio sp. ACV-2]
MSRSEDYLDGLLNSINRAKTDAEYVQENVERKQQKFVESRKAVNPDEDFFAATGIDVRQTRPKSSHPYLRKVFSEEDFLRKFEEELENEDDADSFLAEFEEELNKDEQLFMETGKAPDDEGVVDKLLNNIDNAVANATKQLDENPEVMEAVASDDINMSVEPEPIESEPSEPELIDSDLIEEIVEDEPQEVMESPLESSGGIGDEELKLPDDDDIDLSQFIEESDTDEMPSESNDSPDDFGLSLDDMADIEEEPLDDSLKEFLPDDMDALDAAEFGEGEEPDLSGEGDLDVESILEGDEDLLDINSILSGDDEGSSGSADIDTSAEESDDSSSDDGGKKGKKKKEKKEKKEKKKKEKGEKKPNPFLQKLALIIFGAPDEDEIAEMEAEKAKKNGTVEITYDEDGNPIVPEGGIPEDPKEKKKREKAEKKAAKEAAKKEKEEAKKEKEAAKKEKPKKPPKPKKPKKQKEPDNSPKIPLSIIATFLVLSISIIGVVIVGMQFTGLKRHMSQANDLFTEGNYIAAYEKLNGFDFRSDEKVELLRNQARTLADLQQCQDEYVAFMNYDMYNYALDSLLKGYGRYMKYKDDAVKYGIETEYDAFGTTIIQELNDSFGLSEEEAMAIYKQKNRHYYTIELRKVLRGLGLPDT